MKSKQEEYKSAEKQMGWMVIGALIMLPFFIPINTGLQSVIYSFTLVYLGCLYSIQFEQPGQRINKYEKKLEWKDTLSFPLYASIALVTLYFLYGILPSQLLNRLFRLNFCVIGSGILFPFLNSKMDILFPAIPNKKLKKINRVVAGKQINLDITVHKVMAGFITTLLTVLYFWTGHWSLNNILAIAFTVGGIKTIRVPNFKYGMVLLWLLFLYDIYWVFYTDVMVTVARTFDAPIKLSFPANTSFTRFALLGLGDMLIPGICIAVVLKFETDYLLFSQKKKVSNLTMTEINKLQTPMFQITMLFYALSVMATLVGMQLMQIAQPALLYIVPGISMGLISIAYVFKCGKAMLKYEDEE